MLTQNRSKLIAYTKAEARSQFFFWGDGSGKDKPDQFIRMTVSYDTCYIP
jgi:hypothetical protein